MGFFFFVAVTNRSSPSGIDARDGTALTSSPTTATTHWCTHLVLVFWFGRLRVRRRPSCRMTVTFFRGRTKKAKESRRGSEEKSARDATAAFFLTSDRGAGLEQQQQQSGQTTCSSHFSSDESEKAKKKHAERIWPMGLK